MEETPIGFFNPVITPALAETIRICPDCHRLAGIKRIRCRVCAPIYYADMRDKLRSQ